MQKLHLVGFTTDLDGLIFSARKGSKAGGYMVPLDKELLATIAEAERLRNGDKAAGGEGGRPRARPDSRLTPREIQAHLRTGRSIPEVAAEAGVDIEWVERFAVPIVAEQAQMVERARRLTYSKARLGQSAQPLGTSVRWNLADKAVAISEDAFEQGWSAFQLQDEVWMIRFRYTSRARLQVAEWELDLDVSDLHSRNRLASELGFIEKGRRAPALPAPPPARPPAAAPMRVTEEVVDAASEPEERPAPTPARRRKRATRKRVAARRPAKKKATAKKKKKTTARKAAAGRRAAPKRTMARKATTKKTKATAKRAAPKKATTKKTKPRRRPAKRKATPRAAKRTTAAPARKAAASEGPPKAAAPRPAAKRTVSQPRATARRAEPRPAAAAAAPERTRRRGPRPAKGQRPRIAGATAREAAAAKGRGQATGSKRPPRPRRPTEEQPDVQPEASAVLSGPLARSLLARRLMARKAAEGDGGQRTQRPLRVR